ncbi:biotin--protein ligase 2 isoform X1 [Amborella trichopoda]|uniref:biotin--protein ligase 2 isoform X1 n=2 Tax=Amborella trichopoda TaxID=13333 RepID=UPI0005D35CC9|nr:biotin--protein ligase 2 isoform X1 [Amborella trichopoda]|eukprot:XP_011626364.1 biotin--protein ligase 2 isoform X1 [Amborella trichopoda]
MQLRHSLIANSSHCFLRHPYFKTLFDSSLSLSTRKLNSSVGMEDSAFLIVLRGKSRSEEEYASSLKHKKSLRLPDGELQILLQSELQQNDATKTFQIDSYMDILSTHQFGRLLIWSPRISSTHDLVSLNFCELPLGTACIADVQVKGRGRAKNVWQSPVGCLLFSFTLQMDNGRIVPHVQYVVSLAVTEAIKVICKEKGLPDLDVKIKWPNDLYLNGLKVGGILCTSTYRSKKFNVSAGIGLNVDNHEPTTCLNAVLQKLTSGAQCLRREHILAAFFERFEVLFDVFINQGFQALEEVYYATWLHSGQKVVIEEKNECGLPQKSVVTVQGLTPSGYLLAVDDEDKRYELHPDGNSFDFFQGLIRRKVEA